MNVTEKISDRGEQTRKRIVAAATCLFTKNGYGRTSLSQILEATGLTKGGFYFHFKTKEDLGCAVVQSLERCWTEDIMPRINSAASVQEKITALLTGGCDCHQREGSRPFVLLMTLAAETFDSTDRVAEMVRRVFRGWRQMIAGLIEEGKAQGQFPANVNSDALAGIILSTILGANLQALLNGRPQEYEDQLHCLQRLLLHALMRPMQGGSNRKGH
jgi:AcrR family transcriptional regulator